MSDPRGGAGTAGGLLFVAVILVIGYLLVSAVAGVLKFVIGAAILLVVAALVIRVLQRR
jgi:hypothetical protein